MKWGWLFRTYVQWHAIAFLLSELCVRTKGEAVERAWRALEATAGKWWYPLNESANKRYRQGYLWKPLRKLMAKARAARERELALERAAASLKTRTTSYADIGQVFDTLPPTTQQQPYEQLDAMLQPTAPRLGEVPSSSPPRITIGQPISPTNIEGQNFKELTDMGFDWLMGDLSRMDPLTEDITPGSINGLMQDRNSSSRNSNPSPNSSALGDGGLDWANWDDMVREYGVDVDMDSTVPSQMNINGAGIMRLPTWF